MTTQATPRPMKRTSRDPASLEGESADAGAEEEVGWASLDCLPDILARLKDQDGPRQLAKARLVCSRWSKAASSALTSWDLVYYRDNDRDGKARLLQKLSSLRELTVYDERHDSGIAESLRVLVSAACSLQNLKSLRLRYEGTQAEVSKALLELMPLLPRLETLKFSATTDSVLETNSDIDATKALTEALGAASSLTELDVSQIIPDPPFSAYDLERRCGVPVEGLAALPGSLTRLRIDHVAFRDGQSLETLRFMPHLQELWIASCVFHGSIGLRCATGLKSLTCCYAVDLKEMDLEDILTLQGLEHLRLSKNVASSFVRRLPFRLRSLVSLSLWDWRGIAQADMQAIGSITGLTSLDITAVDSGLNADIAPEWLRHLRSLTRLRKLVLNNHNAAGFLATGLPHLQGLPALKSLDLGGICVEHSGEDLKLLPPGLEEIGLSGCFQCEAEYVDGPRVAMYKLAQQCRNLVSIDLGFIPFDFLDGIAHFSSLPQLQKVIIYDPYEMQQEDVEDIDTGSNMWLSHRLPQQLSRLGPLLSVIRKTRNLVMPHHTWCMQDHPRHRGSVLLDLAQEVVNKCGTLCREWEASAAP